MKFIFLSLLLFITLPENLKAESSPTEIQSFDLKKTILITMENSPYFDSLKRQKNISDLEEQSARAKLFPNLDLSTTHGIQDTSPHQNNHPWTSEFQLALTETLYDNGTSKTQYRIATLSKAQAELKFLDQKNKLSLDIASQFLTYSRDMKLLEIQEKQFKLINKQYAAISKDYYQGIKTKKDFLRFKTQVSRSDIDLLNARNNTEKSKSELLKIIGIGINSTVKIDFIPIAIAFSENQIPDLTIKLENHFQYKIAQVQKEINQLKADLVNRKNLPEWYASAGVNYSSSDYLGTDKSLTNNGTMGWNMLLTIKYNFLDWGIRSRDQEIAIHKNNIQNNEIDSDLLNLKLAVDQHQSNLKKLKKNIILAQELLSLEQNNVDFIEREYQNGKTQYLDLITGLYNLSDAQIKFFSAISDFKMTVYTLLYHQGNLYEEIVK